MLEEPNVGFTELEVGGNPAYAFAECLHMDREELQFAPSSPRRVLRLSVTIAGVPWQRDRLKLKYRPERFMWKQRKP